MTASNTTFLALVALCGAATSWGGIAACAPAAHGTTLTSLNTGTAPNGCGVVDLSFANFSVSGVSEGCTGTGCTTPATPAMGNIAMYSSGNTGASGNTVGPVNALFDGDGVANNWNLSGSGTQTQDVTINYLSQANTGGTYNGGANSYPSPSNPDLVWTYSGLFLTATAAIDCTGGCSANAQQIKIIETFCIGATSTAAGTGGCLASNEGTITETITGVANSTSGAVTTTFACLFNGVSCGATNQYNFIAVDRGQVQIAISDAVSITRTSGDGATVTLTNFENQFDELSDSPEPSTFVMLGSALAGLAALRLRKRKQG